MKCVCTSELRESLTRVGNDLKNKLMDSLRSTWNSIHDFAMAHRAAATPESLQQEMDKEMTSVIQQLQQQNEEDKIETGCKSGSTLMTGENKSDWFQSQV